MGSWGRSRGREVFAVALASALSAAVALAASPAAPTAVAQDPVCTPLGGIEAIIDDSSSMLDTDPDNLRSGAVELLIDGFGSEARTLGAIEFSGEGRGLFGPAVIGSTRREMRKALTDIVGDGTTGSSTGTNYNAAFATAATHYPDAAARIFLTDGAHLTDDHGAYANGHRGGPPTYVLGFGDSTTGEDGERLQGIANDTGGAYFPSVDSASLQPTMAVLNAIFNCQVPVNQFADDFTSSGETKVRRMPLVDATPLILTTTWTSDSSRFSIRKIVIKRNGKTVAGVGKKYPRRKRIGFKKRSGETFSTVQITGLRPGKLTFQLKANETYGDRATTLVTTGG